MKRLVAAVVLAGAVLAGCSGDDDTITVSAAASLTDAFTEIGEIYAAENPGKELRFNFAGSSSLAEQIVSGADVDVFASASAATMQSVIDAGRAADPVAFAGNTLAIAVPLSNPAAVQSLSDLANPAVKVLVCDDPVPCGAAAIALFSKNQITVNPVSKEPDPRAVLTKISVNEADAGIVYRTDINETVTGIMIPSEQNVTTEYLISSIVDASPGATDFIDLVLSPRGLEVMSSYGFEVLR